MSALRPLDEKLFMVAPVIMFLILLGLFGWYLYGDEWIALSGQTAAQRGQLYSALAGAAAGILGFALAALSILVAFGRPSDPRLRIGNRGLVKVLLTLSLLLLVVLIASLTSIAIDTLDIANPVCASLVLASSFASAVGLALSILAFSLAILAYQQE